MKTLYTSSSANPLSMAANTLFHLTKKPVNMKKLLLPGKVLVITLLLLFTVAVTQAATYYSRTSGNWNSNSTWSTSSHSGDAASTYPGASDVVNIGSHTVTVAANAACTSITLDGDYTGTLSINSGCSLTVSGAVTVKSSTSGNSSLTLSGAGSLSSASLAIGTNITTPYSSNRTVSFTTSVSSYTISGNLTLFSNYRSLILYSYTINASYSESSGSVTVNGTITSDNEGSSNTSTFTLGNSSPTLNLGGSTCFSLDGTGTSTIILNGTGATVNYNRSGAQNVYATTYTNLITSGSGIKTLAGNSSITGNLTVNSASTLDLSTYTANRSISGGTLTVASGATLKIGGTNTLPSNYSTHTIECASTVEYSGGNQTITEPASTATYGNLILSGTGTKTLQTGTTSICNNFTMSGTSPSATAVVGITIGGSVTLGSGTTFNAGSYTHNVAGSWTNNGATFTASASTINFNGSNVANINGSATTTFYNLTINKDASSTKVLSSQKAFNVNNDLTVAKGILQLDAIDANYVVSKNLTVNTGATLKHNAGWIDATSQYVLLSVGGNLIIEGTYDYSDQTRTHIQMSGTGTKNISAPNTSLSILTLLDGDYYATGNVNINDNFWSMFGSTGSFHTNGQTVTAQAAVLNNGGTLDINGGVLNVTGGLSIVAGNLSGACTFSNGELNADIVTIGNGATTGTLTQSGGTANIGNLSISSTGTYTCTNSPAINLSGDWTNNGGTFTPATSTVTFNGSGAQNINGSVATQTFNNLVVNKTAGTTLSVGGSTTTLNVGGIFTETQGNFNAPATMAVTGNITLAAGTFTAGSSLTAGGHWTNNGATFTHNNGTVTFNGSSQKIGGSYANTFYNLTINGSAVVLNSLAYPQLTTVSNILTINSSKVLTVPAAQQLTVNGTTYLNGTECLVIDCASDGTTPSGSFIDNGFAGSGTAKVNRYFDNSGTAGGISWDWHLLSSPVTSQAIWPAFVPSPPSSWTLPTDWDFYYYNPNTPYVYPHTPWVNIKTATGAYNSGDFDKEGDDAGFGATTPPVMRIARGYLVAYDNAGVKSFIGSLNTGTVNATVKNTKDSFNLVGNPYPSSIDWKSSALGRSNLKDVGSGKYAYWVYNEDYGNYGTILSDASVGTNGTTNFIAPGQGFFVKAKDLTSSGGLARTILGFSQSARAHSTQNWLKDEIIEGNYIKLKLTTNANTFADEVIIFFDDEYLGAGGADKFGSWQTVAPELYTVKDGKSYSIDLYQGVTPELIVNLSAKCAVNSTYTITATDIDAFDLSNIVYLEDLKTGNKVNLKETGSYSFTGGPNDDKARFRVTFAEITGTNDAELQKPVYIYSFGKDVFVNAGSLTTGSCDVYIYDALGRLVYNGRYIPVAGNHKFTTLQIPGAYVVKVISRTGTTTEKVIIP